MSWFKERMSDMGRHGAPPDSNKYQPVMVRGVRGPVISECHGTVGHLGPANHSHGSSFKDEPNFEPLTFIVRSDAQSYQDLVDG